VLEVVYALETSVRRSMESGLEWKQVDGFLVWIYVRVCSTKMSRTVPPSHEVWSGASYCRQRPEVETLACMHVCMYVCMHACTYMYLCISIYVCSVFEGRTEWIYFSLCGVRRSWTVDGACWNNMRTEWKCFGELLKISSEESTSMDICFLAHI
jgi:hypothetical protein